MSKYLQLAFLAVNFREIVLANLMSSKMSRNIRENVRYLTILNLVITVRFVLTVELLGVLNTSLEVFVVCLFPQFLEVDCAEIKLFGSSKHFVKQLVEILIVGDHSIVQTEEPKNGVGIVGGKKLVLNLVDEGKTKLEGELISASQETLKVREEVFKGEHMDAQSHKPLLTIDRRICSILLPIEIIRIMKMQCIIKIMN